VEKTWGRKKANAMVDHWREQESLTRGKIKGTLIGGQNEWKRKNTKTKKNAYKKRVQNDNEGKQEGGKTGRRLGKRWAVRLEWTKKVRKTGEANNKKLGQ